MEFASLFEDRGTWRDWKISEIDEIIKLIELDLETGGHQEVGPNRANSVSSFRQGEHNLRLLIAIFSHACNYGVEYIELKSDERREEISNDATLVACRIASTLLQRGITTKTIRSLQNMFMKGRSTAGYVDRKSGAALRVVRAVMLVEALLLMARSRYSNDKKRLLPQFECNWLEFLQSLTEIASNDGIFFGLALPVEDLKCCALELNDASIATSLGKRFSSVFSLTFLQTMQLHLSAGKVACVGGLHLSLLVPRPSDMYEKDRAVSYLSHPLLDPSKERDLLEISRKLTESNRLWKLREGENGSLAQSPLDLVEFGMAVLLTLQQVRFQSALSARAFCLDRQQGSIHDLDASVRMAADLAVSRFNEKQMHIVHVAPFHGVNENLIVDASSVAKYVQDELESHSISLANSSSSLSAIFDSLDTSSRIVMDSGAQGSGQDALVSDNLRSIYDELSLTSDGPSFNDVVRDLCTEVTDQSNSISQMSMSSLIQFDSQGDALVPLSGDIVMSAAFQTQSHQVGLNLEGSDWLPVIPEKMEVPFPVRSYSMRSLNKHMQIVHEATILAASDLSLGLIANTIAARTALCLRPLESPLSCPVSAAHDTMKQDRFLGVSTEVDSVCTLASRALIFCPDVSNNTLESNIDSDSNLAFGSIWTGPLHHMLRSASLTFPLRLRGFSALCESLCSLHGSASAVGRFLDSLSSMTISLKSRVIEGYVPESVHSSILQTVTQEDKRSIQKIFINELRGTPVEEKMWTTSQEKAHGEDYSINVDGYLEDAYERGRFLATRLLPLQPTDVQKVYIDNFQLPHVSLEKDGSLVSNSFFERDAFSDGLVLRDGEPSLFYEIKQPTQQERSVYVVMTPDEGGRMKTYSGWALLVRRIVRAARASVSESNVYITDFSNAAGVHSKNSSYLLDKNRTIRYREKWNKGLGNDLKDLSAAARLLSAAFSNCVNLPGLITKGLNNNGVRASISMSNALSHLALSCLDLLKNILFPLTYIAQEQVTVDKTGRLSYDLCEGVQRYAQSFMTLLATLSTAYPSVVYRPLVIMSSETIMDMDTGMNNEFPLLLPITRLANNASSTGDRFFLPMMRVFQSVLHTAQRNADARLLSSLVNQGKGIAHKALAIGLGYDDDTSSQSSSQSSCLGACLMLQSRGLRLLSTLLSCSVAISTTETRTTQPKRSLSQQLLLQEHSSDARLLYYVVRAALQIPLAAASLKALNSFKDADVKRQEERKAAATSHESWEEKRKTAEEAEESCVQVRLPLDLSSQVFDKYEDNACFLSDADLALAEQITLSSLLILQSLFLAPEPQEEEKHSFGSQMDPISYLSAQKTNILLSFTLPEGTDKLCLGQRSRVTVGTHLVTHSDTFSRKATAREPAAYLPPMLLNPVLALLSLVGYDSALVYPLNEHRIPDGLRYVAAVHSQLSSEQRVHIAPASIDTTALSVFTLFTRCMTARRSTLSGGSSHDIGDVLFSDLRSQNFSKTSDKLRLCNRKGIRDLLLGNALIKGTTEKAKRVHDAILLGALRLSRALFEHEKVLHALLNRDDLLEDTGISQPDSINADTHHPSVLDAALEVLLLKDDTNYALGPKLLCEALSFLLQLWQRAASESASAVILRETQRVRKMENVWKRITDIALHSTLHDVELTGENYTFDEKDLVVISRSVFEEEPHAAAKSFVAATRASYAIRSTGLALQLLTIELTWSQSRSLSGVAEKIVESKISKKTFNDLFERFQEHSLDSAKNQSNNHSSSSSAPVGDSLVHFVVDLCTRLNFAPVSSLHCSLRKLSESIGVSIDKYKTPSLDSAPAHQRLPSLKRMSESDRNNSKVGRDEISEVSVSSIPQGSAPIVFLNSFLLSDAAAQPIFGRNFSYSVDHLASDMNMSSAWLRMQSPFVTQLVTGEKRGLFDDIKNRLRRYDPENVVDTFFSDPSQRNDLYRKGACLWAMTLHNTFASVATAQLTRLRGAMSLFVTVILGPLFEKQRVTASSAPIETRVALINCATIAWSRLARGLASASSRFGFGGDSSADAATIEACFTLAQVASVFLNGAISLGSHEHIAKYSLGNNYSGAARDAEILIEKAKLACLEVVIEGLQRSPIRASVFQSGTSSSKYLSQQAMRLTALQVTAATRLCPRSPTEPISLPRDPGVLLPLTLSRGKVDLLARIAVDAMKDALEGIQNNLSTPTTVWSSAEAGTLESASLHFTGGVDLLGCIWKLHAAAFAPSVDRSFAKAMSTPIRKTLLASPFSHLMAAEELASSNNGENDNDTGSFTSNNRTSPVIEALLLARATFDSATKTIAALLAQHHQNWLRFLISHADAAERVSRSTHDQRELFFAGIGLGNPMSNNMGTGGPNDSLTMFALAAFQRASLSPSELLTMSGLSRLIRSSLIFAQKVASGGGIVQKGAMSVAQLGFAESIAGNALFVYMNSVLSERIQSGADVWGGSCNVGEKGKNNPPSPYVHPIDNSGRISASSVAELLVSRGLIASRQAALFLTFAACGHGLSPCAPIRGYGQSGLQRCELHLAWCDAVSLCTVLVKVASSHSMYSSLDAVITLGGIKNICAKFAEGPAGRIALHTALGGSLAFPAFSIAASHEASCAALFLAALSDTSEVKMHVSSTSVRGRLDEENTMLLEGTLSRLRESPYSHWKREIIHDNQSLCEAAPLLSAFCLRDACAAYKTLPKSTSDLTSDDYFARVGQSFSGQVTDTASFLPPSGVSREDIIEQFVPSLPGIHQLRFNPVSESEVSAATLHRKSPRSSPSGSIWRCAAVSSLRHLLASVATLSAALQRLAPNVGLKSTSRFFPDSIDFHGASVVRAWMLQKLLQADVLSPQDQLQVDLALESDKSSPFTRSDALHRTRLMSAGMSDMADEDNRAANLPLPGPEDLCLAIHAAVQSTFCASSNLSVDGGDETEQNDDYNHSSGILPTFPSPPTYFVESIDEDGLLSDEGNARLTFSVLGVPHERGSEMKSLIRNSLFLLSISVDRNFQACAYMSRNERDIINVPAVRSLFTSAVASFGDAGLLRTTLRKLLEVEQDYKQTDESEKINNFNRFGTMRSPSNMLTSSRGVSAGGGGDVPSNNQRSSVYAVFRDSRSTLDDVLKMYEAQYSHSVTFRRMESMSYTRTQTIAKILGDADSSSDPLRLEVIVSHLLTKILFIYFMHERQAISGGRYQDDESNVGLNLLELAFGEDINDLVTGEDEPVGSFMNRIKRAKHEDKNSGLDPITYSLGLELSRGAGADNVKVNGSKAVGGGSMESLD
jgi:hypothetical protein